jgi:predicted phage terminase large subunit-like protein
MTLPPAVPAPPGAQAAVNALLRTDFPSFIAKSFATVSPGAAFLPNWHIEAIAWHLEQVRLGHIRRLIITMPPRSLKSIAASVAFPAYLLGHDPRSRVVCLSYSNDLAAKHANDFRAVLRSDWYRRVFPNTRIDARKDTETEVATTLRGYRLSTSTGGTLTGRGGQTIVIDDPLKPADAFSEPRRESLNEWFSHTLLSRLDDKRTGAVVIVMQRLHEHDLVGHVRELSPDWTVLSLPAIAEREHRVQIGPERWKVRRVGELLHAEREPLLALEEIKANLGSDIFAAQYQQSPVPPGGLVIRRAWIQRYETSPEKELGCRIVQSWDTAVEAGATNDYSVGTTWLFREGAYYLLDVVRKRLEYPDLRREVDAAVERWQPDTVLVEKTGVGAALLQERQDTRVPFIGITPSAVKETRLRVQAAKFEGKQVHLPVRASWLADLEAELFSFPNGRHDDQVDSISQFLEWASLPQPVYRIRRL